LPTTPPALPLARWAAIGAIGLSSARRDHNRSKPREGSKVMHETKSPVRWGYKATTARAQQRPGAPYARPGSLSPLFTAHPPSRGGFFPCSPSPPFPGSAACPPTRRAGSEIVQLRYFAGLSIPEAAKALGVSPRTADRLWAFARVWLLREVGGDTPHE